MNTTIASSVRLACTTARSAGIRIVPGPWFEFAADDRVVACDPMGAVLYVTGNALRSEDLRCPGYVRLACGALGVNFWWLHRFWMGFDRNFQIMFVDGDDKQSPDDVSAFGIQLRRELNV